ncbi:MAG: Flp pilus assembly protein CpaB [Rubellimicrobium sp.]|nr:Flp pilus assembly protein CpaB [Rubellimicrobium sp.]
MRAVFGLILLVGLALAGGAVYMAQGYFNAQQQQIAQVREAVQQATPTVEVLAVNRTVRYGDRITPEDVVTIRYAQPFLPEGTFATMEDLFPAGDTVLRSALRQMEANEPILAVKVTAPGVAPGLGYTLPEGMRAFTIGVSATQSISGFLRPGNRVDVYWSGSIDGQGEVTKLIESAVEIIATDQNADTNTTDIEVSRTVTVQVTPQQVARLAQAQATGSLTIALVGEADTQVAQVVDVNQRNLLDIATPEPVQREQTCTIRTRRGADVVEIPIPCSE